MIPEAADEWHLDTRHFNDQNIFTTGTKIVLHMHQLSWLHRLMAKLKAH